jgi:hypothetical protein
MRILGSAAIAALACFSPTVTQQRPTTISLLDSTFLRIGVVHGPAEQSFSGIVGAVRLSNGLIAVADGDGHVVRFFSTSGAHLRSFGRAGAGPNEFEMLWWMGLCPTGDLLIADAALGRGTVMPPNNAAQIRTVTLPSRILFNRYLSCESDGNVVVLLNRPVLQTVPRGEVRTFPAAVVRFDLDSGAQDTLIALPGTEYFFGNKVAGYSPLPLGEETLAAAGAGRVYAAQNGGDQIHVIDLATSRRTAFRHGLPRTRPTSAARESAKSELIERVSLESTRKLLADVLAEAPVSENRVAFTDMKTDRRGRLWLRLPSLANSVVWRVLTRDGRHVASIRMASRLDPVDIGESHIVAVDRDPLGVQTIRVYSFSSPFIPGGT